MSEEEKPKDAEEILSEYQKNQDDQQDKAADAPADEQQPAEDKKEPEPAGEQPAEDKKEPEPAGEQPAEDKKEPEPAKEEAPETPSEPEGAEKTAQRRDIIFVGSKPIMTYVHATLTQIATNPTVTIKARGKKITHAVDVSQMIVKRMDTVGYRINDVRIASDLLMSEDGKQRNISTIEIDITKD